MREFKMSAPCVQAKLSKVDRKALKKQARSRHTLLKHDGIQTQETPTRVLFVANAGLANNVKCEEVRDIFKKYGTVTRVHMPPLKPYAFVEYSTVEEAKNAAAGIHSRLLDYPSELSTKGVKFYLSYVKSVPDTRTNSGNPSLLPPGLFLLEDFISHEEELALLKVIDWSESAGSMRHRRVKHYGYEFMYDINNIDISKPLEQKIPDMCRPLLSRLLDEGHITEIPDQLTVNEYLPGQGIPPHIDTHSAFHDGILSLALGSQVVMDFKNPDGQHIPVLIPRRCLIIMTQASRYVWTHGITPRKSDVVPLSFAKKCRAKNDDVHSHRNNDENIQEEASGGEVQTLLERGTRTSFTFRKVRGTPCDCAFPEFCDSQKLSLPPQASLPSSSVEAVKLEADHVHKVYDEIAGHFSDTRHTPWPRIMEFLKQQPQGALLADIGCGNGKYLGVNKQLYELGCERSQNLANICQQRAFNICVADVLQTPLRSDCVDVCLCIAVIHHLSTEVRRQEAIEELVRITCPGGQILIYVWALEQELHRVKSNYLKEKKELNVSATEVKGVLSPSEAKKDLSGEFRTVSPQEGNNSSHNAMVTSNDASLSTQKAPNSSCIPKAGYQCKGDNEFSEVTNKKPVTNSNEAVEQGAMKVQTDTRCLPVHVNRTQFAKPDLLVPWHMKSSQKKKTDNENAEVNNKQVFHRYYHVFREGELEEICRRVPNVVIKHQYYDKGNWCVLLRKLDAS